MINYLSQTMLIGQLAHQTQHLISEPIFEYGERAQLRNDYLWMK